MDPQTLQSLMAPVQQLLQVLQQLQAGSAGAPPAAPGAAPAAGGPPGGPMDMDDGDDDMYADDDGNPGDMDDDAAEDGMGTGQSLHDRVSQLEGHTGLKKSASGGTLSDRLDALESEILGVEYQGPMVERVRQLEKAAGIGPSYSTGMRKSAAAEEAPDEIPLDALIKSAIQKGIEQGMAALAGAAGDDDLIPDLTQMRKTARSNGRGDHYGKRRSAAPVSLSDADLVKSAAQLGWTEEELDQEFSLGDALQMQYNAQQSGEPIPFADDDDD